MRITGIVIAAIGTVILLMSGMMATQSQENANYPNMAGGSLFAGREMVLGAFGLVALISGVALAAYGGRGFFVSRDLEVRR